MSAFRQNFLYTALIVCYSPKSQFEPEHLSAMADYESILPKEMGTIGITDLYNSSPSKVQPWMQTIGGIPVKRQMCSGDVGPEADSTHGTPEGNWLIMTNAPIGLKPDL